METIKTWERRRSLHDFPGYNDAQFKVDWQRWQPQRPGVKDNKVTDLLPGLLSLAWAPWECDTEQWPLLNQCLWTRHSAKAAENTESAMKKNKKKLKSPLEFRENESTVAKKFFGACRLQALIAVWPKQTCSHSYFSFQQQSGKIVRNRLAPRLAPQQTGQGPTNRGGSLWLWQVTCAQAGFAPRGPTPWGRRDKHGTQRPGSVLHAGGLSAKRFFVVSM